ncbi:MAG TPA: sigma-54-dependent Fis family transcriptional regulator, partial [bacterium]|nr:sigma-54-dependent Fis family transcriptional regulator [bacterium]
TYDWPGNVRELRHLMERVFVLVEPLKVTSQHLYDLLAGKRSLSRDEEEDPDYRQAVKAFEKSYITNQLISNGWNISQTARRMRVARSMLYKKMDEYGIRQMSSD